MPVVRPLESMVYTVTAPAELVTVMISPLFGAAANE
jgi:hypothetical protein